MTRKDVQTPEWLLEEERRDVPKDSDLFLRKTADALRFTLSNIRRVPERRRARLAFSPPVKLGLTLTIVLLTSASRNFAFVEIVGCVLLVVLATFEAQKLLRVLTFPFQAFLLSILILVPSLIWGQTRAIVVVPCKTFISTTVIALLAYSTNWNRFTCAFKTFGVPDALVFIFDLTLKYIVVFGEICLETLDAVCLRSVGCNRRKTQTLGGIVGVGFLRVEKFAQEQFDAMSCRCFSGNYRRFRAPFRSFDLLGFFLGVCAFVLFFYLEYAIRCSN